MASKDLKPKHKIGHSRWSARKKILVWTALLLCASGVIAAYRMTATTAVDVPVARVRRGDFVISVKTRGEIRSTRSMILTAPQVPDPRIVKLAESGRPIKKGDVVVEFDAVQQEQNFIERSTSVRTADSEIVQLKASQKIEDEMDGMNLMQSEYNVERAKLEASKAEILSQIEGAKNRIDVGVSQGELGQVKTSIQSRKISHSADDERLGQKKDKTVRDMNLAKSYMSKMVMVAPNDGIVNILPNFRSGGSFGSSPPAFKEGDRAWTGAAIAEIPDLSEMRMELKLEEVDRGKLKLGQPVHLRVDAIPEKQFTADLDWISPIATLVFRSFPPEKLFPAKATLKTLDPRLRPGMSATAEIDVERQPGVLLIPAKASFLQNGKPSVYVQQGQKFLTRNIQVGKRNEDDLVVLSGLKEGEIVTLESPADAAKRARKKL
ncbi:MAG: HlyD family efflux transporter periplasmic adaptor subunit [Acidobacteriota bacterium]|nr:HlyD family efflux transporter periplasmic adaptor subunit [Acidobacteriota bacterium]